MSGCFPLTFILQKEGSQSRLTVSDVIHSSLVFKYSEAQCTASQKLFCHETQENYFICCEVTHGHPMSLQKCRPMEKGLNRGHRQVIASKELISAFNRSNIYIHLLTVSEDNDLDKYSKNLVLQNFIFLASN